MEDTGVAPSGGSRWRAEASSVPRQPAVAVEILAPRQPARGRNALRVRATAGCWRYVELVL